MQSPGFAPESERYMLDHMNADHADSNLMYVKVYGSLWQRDCGPHGRPGQGGYGPRSHRPRG